MTKVAVVQVPELRRIGTIQVERVTDLPPVSSTVYLGLSAPESCSPHEVKSYAFHYDDAHGFLIRVEMYVK